MREREGVSETKGGIIGEEECFSVLSTEISLLNIEQCHSIYAQKNLGGQFEEPNMSSLMHVFKILLVFTKTEKSANSRFLGHVLAT